MSSSSSSVVVSVRAVEDLQTLLTGLPALAKLKQVFRLELEKAALDGGGAAQPPYRLASLSTSSLFGSRLCVIVGGHGPFEGP